MITMSMEYTLLHGDCLQLMKALPPQSVDMILVDTPFGTTRNHWDTALDIAAMWEQSIRLIKPHGAIVHFATQPYTSMLVMSHLKGYKHAWIWNKRQSANFAVAKYMPMTITEDILIFTAKGERSNYYPIMTPIPAYTRKEPAGKMAQGFGGMTKLTERVYDALYPKNMLSFSPVVRDESLHPSQKPVDLLAYLIKTYTNPGETVLDFCMGSGSTGVACAETGRNFIGFELYPLPNLPISEDNPDYFAIAQKRIDAAYRRASGLPKLGKATDTADLPLFASGLRQ